MTSTGSKPPGLVPLLSLLGTVGITAVTAAAKSLADQVSHHSFRPLRAGVVAATSVATSEDEEGGRE